MKQVKQAAVASLKLLAVMTLICGGLYTIVVTGFGQLFFNHQANGSVIEAKSPDGKTVIAGSHLIGQSFTEAGYLIGRPNTEPSNLSPVSAEQADIVKERVATFQALEPSNQQAIPSELVLGSASGLDPEISLVGANYQVKRIAKERQLSEKAVTAIIRKHTNKSIFGKIGTSRVNVLAVNLELAGYTLIK